MGFNKKICVYLIILMSLSTALLFASMPQLWKQSKQSEFEKGKSMGVSITSKGEIILAPKLKLLLDTEQPFVWCLARDSKGNIYAGTGNDGKVFRIDKKDRSSLFFDADDLEVHSLAIDVNDNVFVGTGPEGKIYKVSPSGSLITSIDLGVEYIWTMVNDKPGNLFIGTGNDGKIYRVAKDGGYSIFYDSNEVNITALAIDNRGNLVAGSDENGLIFRISPQGKPFVIFDSSLREVRALFVDKQGSIFAGANSDISVPSAPATKVPSAEQEENTGEAGGAVVIANEDEGSVVIEEAPSGPTRVGRERSEVYKIDQDGFVDVLWQSNDEIIFSIAGGFNDDFVIATGDKGRIFSLNNEKEKTMLLEADEAQATALLKDRQRIFLATSNLGKIYSLDSTSPLEGTFESDVKDVEIVSTWGKISWEADVPIGTKLSLSTRSGNTEKPDETWSDWSNSYSEGEQVASPRARYIQWKATLTSTKANDTPKLTEVTIPYLEENAAPEINSITIYPAGTYYQTPPQSNQDEFDDFQTSAGPKNNKNDLSNRRFPRGKRSFRFGIRTVSWVATDENGDDLIYQLYFKAEDEENWRKLTGEQEETYHSWDTRSLPDGRYRLKVISADSPSNPEGSEKSSEKISESFIIDNTAPVIKNISTTIHSSKVNVSFDVQDNQSIISRLEYAIDGGEWQFIFPEDRIMDSRIEKFSFTTKHLDAGEHTVVMRAIDDMNNVGSGKAVVKVK